ncbi:MAG: hypothetical protein CMM88_06550 [Rickettsiales bacterium]|nr:hypothetical protein [Rickettsiales bacterium]MEC7835158.1 DUF3126 family protein [Pseudomonadota bacterium]HAE74823.1 DUF3126 domain-containing protein [Alphaproteobacteria bacterium]MBC36751.1 hypothetical protein [Rickettsiales bacterium]MBV31388.1 hypothetical protein [Rickettsiales bacterium]
MDNSEIDKVQKYLRKKFGTEEINLEISEKAKDQVEVKLGSEFVGTLYKDEEEGEISYAFQMAILQEDLD